MKKYKNFKRLTLSDLILGNFKVKLNRINKNYIEYYIDETLVAQTITDYEFLFVDEIMEIIKSTIQLSETQIEHQDSIAVEKLTKTSIKQALRKYLEDLLYLDGLTPVELSGYSWKDFR